MDDKTICLVRPPDKKQEDIIMNENKLSDKTVVIEENVSKESANKEILTVFDVMAKLDELRNDLNYLNDVIEQVEDSDEEKLEVLESIVQTREGTYHKLISFYEKVYDDVKPRALSAERRAEFILEAMQKMPEQAAGAHSPDYASLIKSISEAL